MFVYVGAFSVTGSGLIPGRILGCGKRADVPLSAFEEPAGRALASPAVSIPLGVRRWALFFVYSGFSVGTWYSSGRGRF